MMLDSTFKVGDTIRLSGLGWDSYISYSLLNELRVVREVDKNGVAEIIIHTVGGDSYLGWVSPNKEDALFGTIVQQVAIPR